MSGIMAAQYKKLLGACLVLAIGALSGVSGAAFAGNDVQTMRYALTIDGKAVGQRDVTIRHFPAADYRSDPSRIIESYLALDTTIAGVPVHYTTRASARVKGGRSSFTSVVDENGTLREVQGRRLSDGSWRVTVLESGSRAGHDLRRSEVDLTSMDLLDPERHQILGRAAEASVLVADTGQVYTGAVEDKGEASLQVGGGELIVHRWGWAPEQGRVSMAWTLDGLLASYDVAFMGKTLRAVLMDLPAERVFGEIEVSGLGGETVVEEEL